MPLFKTINHNQSTQILVWSITESVTDLLIGNPLKPESQNRLATMKSAMHQCAFLAVRKMLLHLQISDHDLHYDATGKPTLSSGKYISISHSHAFATVVISNQAVGIDIELQREKIIDIANKFSVEPLNSTNKTNYIKKLTVIWGAKEAIFKIKNQKGISFKDHIFVKPFQTYQNQTEAIVQFNQKTELYLIYYYEIDNYMLVYALADQTQAPFTDNQPR